MEWDENMTKEWPMPTKRVEKARRLNIYMDCCGTFYTM